MVSLSYHRFLPLVQGMHTVGVTNRFKGLDLVECVKDYGWRSATFIGGDDQNHPKEKEMQEGTVVV